MYNEYFEKEYKRIKEYERLSNKSFYEFTMLQIYKESKKYIKKENNIKYLMMLLSFLFGMLLIIGVWTAFESLGKNLFTAKGILMILTPCLPVMFILLRWIFKTVDDPIDLAKEEFIETNFSLSTAYLNYICPTSLIRDCYSIHKDTFKLPLKDNQAVLKIKKKLIKNSLRGQKVAKQYIKDLIAMDTYGAENIKDAKINRELKKTIFKKYRRFVTNKNIKW